MSRWRLRACEPTGTRRVRGLACGRRPGGGAVSEIVTYDLPVYAVRAEALALAARRQALDLTLHEAARRLRLRLVELADLEHGRVDLAEPADWPRLLAALEAPGPEAP